MIFVDEVLVAPASPPPVDKRVALLVLLQERQHLLWLPDRFPATGRGWVPSTRDCNIKVRFVNAEPPRTPQTPKTLK
eukprot:4668424-Amphidinium_carterae.1